MPSPGEDGLLVPRSSYPDLQATVRAYRRNPYYHQIPQRRPRPVFQPSAGSKVYQCVSGTKLRLGTVLEPERGDIFEPVVVCVELGNITSDDLRNLKNDTVFKLQDRIKQLGIVDNRNRIDSGVFGDNKDSDQFTAIVRDDIGSETGLTALRARFLDGYAPTGAILVGNDTEAWYGSTVKTLEVTTASNWTNGASLTAAKLKINQPAIDAHVATDLIYDYVALRNPITNLQSMYVASGTKVIANFRQNENLSDDQAYSNEFWYDHSDLGTLPIFDAMNLPTTMRVKTTHILSPMSSNGSFPADIYEGTPGSETQVSGSPTLTNIWNGTQCTVNSSKFMTVLLVGGGPWWHVVEADTS